MPRAHYSGPGTERTYRLIDSTVPLAVRLIRLSRLRALGTVTRQVIAVVDDVRG